MKSTPEPQDPFVMGQAEKPAKKPEERWVPHPDNKHIEVNIAAPGEFKDKPRRTKQPLPMGWNVASVPWADWE